MTRGARRTFVAVALAAAACLPSVASAQVGALTGCSSCSGSEFEAFLRLGPTFSGGVSLGSNALGPQVGGIFRAGTLAGLPVQVETTLAVTEIGAMSIAGGVRLIPLGWLPGKGLVLGGGEGVSVGAIGGVSQALTFYVGPVVEVMLFKEFGLVAEWVFPLGGALRARPSVTLALKFGFPALREQAWR